MTGKLTIEVIGNTAKSFLNTFPTGAGPHKLGNALLDVLAQMIGGSQPGHLRMRVDDSVPTTASATVAITYANLAAADVLSISDPAIGTIYLTCVSTAPVAGDGTFRKVTDASATGDSLVTCINTHASLRGRYTASNNAGTVTITVVSTAGNVGAQGNKTTLGKQMANPAGLTLSAFTGGRDGGSKQTLTATLGANPTAAQTFLIGAKTITFRAAAANQDEVTIGADAAATAVALVTVLNANTDLAGFFVATSLGSAALSIEMQVSGQMGRFVSVGGTATSLAWTNTQTAVTATHFGPTTTETNVVASQGVTLGLRAAAS